MRFTELDVRGVYVVTPEPMRDERGFFARTWCKDEFGAQGLVAEFAQCSVSFNHRRGTLRGMHYQIDPAAETKLVRCTRGAIHDVVIDLRLDSPSLGKWAVAELTADNGRMLWIPEGIAHGFQTLEDATEVSYQISRPYSPEHARGVRWNDPAFGIVWPDANPRILSERDRTFEDFVP